MQFIKRFGKQLGFVVLIGSAMFSASSASAVKTRRIAINTDLIIDPAQLQTQFPGVTELKLFRIGGYHYSDPSGKNAYINFQGASLYDPFNNVYGRGNNLIVGGSSFSSKVESNGGTTNPSFTITGEFKEDQLITKPNNGILTFGLTSSATNPPALSLGDNTNYVRCIFTKCVVFHYGYEVTVGTRQVINPYFLGSFFEVRKNDSTGNRFQSNEMASPEIDLNSPVQEDTPTDFLIVYSEQTNPEQPGVVIVNWTEFPVNRGQTPTFRFTNSESNFDPITVSNTRVLRSATKIPLEQLTAADLPPTTEGFVEFPGANGIVPPGKTRDAVTLTGIPVTGTPILDGIVSFNGTSDYREFPTNENLNFGTGDLSISAWVKTTSTSGIEVILDKRVETTGPIQGYALSNYNGNLLLQLADGVGNQFTNYVTNISIADGNWHHVAVTVDRNQPDGGRWYLDGVEVVGERFNPTRRGSLSNSKPLVIGRRSDNPGWPGFFKGEIGSVRLDKRVLSSQEIKAIAANKP